MEMYSKDESKALFADDGSMDSVVFQENRQKNIFLTETHWSRIILAFVVTIFCCPIFGAIAFGLAGTAEGIKYQNGVRARRLAKSSLYLSVAGIVIGVILIIAAIVMYVWLWGVVQQQLQLLKVFLEQLQQSQPQPRPDGY